MEFNFVLSNWPKRGKARRDNRKACKPGGRKFGMEINFVLFSNIRKLRNLIPSENFFFYGMTFLKANHLSFVIKCQDIVHWLNIVSLSSSHWLEWKEEIERVSVYCMTHWLPLSICLPRWCGSQSRHVIVSSWYILIIAHDRLFSGSVVATLACLISVNRQITDILITIRSQSDSWWFTGGKRFWALVLKHPGRDRKAVVQRRNVSSSPELHLPQKILMMPQIEISVTSPAALASGENAPHHIVWSAWHSWVTSLSGRLYYACFCGRQ